MLPTRGGVLALLPTSLTTPLPSLRSTPAARRRVLVALALAALAGLAGPLSLGVAPASAAAGTPPDPPAMSGIEGFASYVPDNSCDGVVKPGTARLAALLTSSYPGTTAGTIRGCGSDGSISEHYDGRAVDWMTSVRTADGSARAGALLSWLFATVNGQPYANARRLGVMYVIWDNSIWGAYSASAGWRPYSTCASHPETSWDTACHRDHIHLSLSWEGAMGRTSYWTHSVAAPDYGPCRVADLTWAPPYAGARSTPCPSVPAVPVPAGTSDLMQRLIAASGAVLGPGSVGAPVAAVNQFLGLGTGTTWTSTTSTYLRWFQGARGLATTGVMDVPTWRATTGPTVSTAVDPRGNLESVSGDVRLVNASGWAFDGEVDTPVQVRVTVDGASTSVTANLPRPDVAAAFPGRSANHGFAAQVAVAPGAHTVCVTVVNTGAGTDLPLGCRTVTAAAPVRVVSAPSRTPRAPTRHP